MRPTKRWTGRQRRGQGRRISIIGVSYPTPWAVRQGNGQEPHDQDGKLQPPPLDPAIIEPVRTGADEPRGILTMVEPMMSAINAYKAFDRRRPGWIKVELLPAKHAAE
jgi:hypothetical protein